MSRGGMRDHGRVHIRRYGMARGVEPEGRHGQAAGVRPAHDRGARHPVRAAVVHGRARLPQVGGGGAGRARERVRGGHRLRRLRDRGSGAGSRGRHAREARPVDVPGAARGAATTWAPRGCSPTSSRRTASRRWPTRATCSSGRWPRPPSRASPSTRTPRSSSTWSRTRSCRAWSPSRSTGPGTSTTCRAGTTHDFRRAAITVLESMGISVEFSHHEGGPGQNEIDLRYADALSTADNIMTFRTVIKEVALEQGALRHVHAEAAERAPRLRACTRTCRCSRATATPSTRPAPSTS